VQSLSSARGEGRKRRSADALLKRGIAAPHSSSRGLPVLASARRLITRSPKSVRLGKLRRDRVRGKWLVVSLFFLASALLYGAWIGGETERLYQALGVGVEKLAVAAGFGAKRITVEGQLHATDAEITAALHAGPDTMMLGFDTDAAKARLEAVPWIKHAQVMRLLPSTLQVQIEERVPYAVWQSHGQTYVVDAEGVTLAPALREAYPDLPLVVGDGAAKAAPALYQALKPYGDLEQKMIAAIRVGDRRWTLKLASGLEIMLPDDNVDEALAALTKFDEEHGLLKRDIASVDLRLLDRITVRLREEADASPPGAEAVQEPPTSSTKTQVKGKT
jgi:cell division protein FtsQ